MSAESIVSVPDAIASNSADVPKLRKPSILLSAIVVASVLDLAWVLSLVSRP